jgi:hypothetical protein
VPDAVDEHGQLDRDTLRIDVPAGAHREINAVEPERLQRPAELATVHSRQVLRKEAQRTRERRVALRSVNAPALTLRQVQGHCRTRRGLHETAPAQSFHGGIV